MYRATVLMASTSFRAPDAYVPASARYQNLMLNFGVTKGPWDLVFSIANAGDHDGQYSATNVVGWQRCTAIWFDSAADHLYAASQLRRHAIANRAEACKKAAIRPPFFNENLRAGYSSSWITTVPASPSIEIVWLVVLNPLRPVADTQHRRDTILTSHHRTVGKDAADIGH